MAEGKEEKEEGNEEEDGQEDGDKDDGDEMKGEVLLAWPASACGSSRRLDSLWTALSSRREP